MRSPRKPRSAARRQAGFTLIEVMAASVILSVFVLGIGAMWQASGNRVTDLTVRQKAVFVLNAEMERLSAMYAWTDFGHDGPVWTSGYGGGDLPSSRLIYPTNVDEWVGGGGLADDFVTSSKDRFEDSEFLIWHEDNWGTSSDRIYVWLDQDANLAARLSWTEQDIRVGADIDLAGGIEIDLGDCEIGADDCSCHDFNGSSSWWNADDCRLVELYLEFPFRRQSNGEMEAMDSMRAITLTTIVGRL